MYIKLMLSQPLFMVEIKDEVTLFTTWVDGVKKLRIDLTPASQAEVEAELGKNTKKLGLSCAKLHSYLFNQLQFEIIKGEWLDQAKLRFIQ